ncbi:hypothetical protein H2199_001619 [Coniosporium tulheliwenetii]|uniref:Uncharacterized protein n=1 Tax=Coniosporium tulheliwenetii TaxID=3383036 RepID=A0ACC2ZK08_9PEZI|nr:hypothetical protein H2199_001619 [Cladosporium sp. JES 115]
MAPRFTIVMDDAADKTYIPGDKVSGMVILDVPRKLKRKALMLSFIGEFRYVYYTSGGGPYSYYQQAYIAGIPFLKFDQTLHPGPVNLANEKRVWTFDFKFPKEFTPFYAQNSTVGWDSLLPSSILPSSKAPIISFQHLQFGHAAKQPPGAPEIQVVTLKGQHRNSGKLPSSIHALGEKFTDGRPNWETHTPCIQFVPKIHAPKGTTPDQQIPLSLAIELRHGKDASDGQTRPRLVLETVSVHVANSWVHRRRKKGDRLVHREALQIDVPLNDTPVSLVEQFELQDAEPSFAFPVGGDAWRASITSPSFFDFAISTRLSR